MTEIERFLDALGGTLRKITDDALRIVSEDGRRRVVFGPSSGIRPGSCGGDQIPPLSTVLPNGDQERFRYSEA
jgi:hypothetical protein